MYAPLWCVHFYFYANLYALLRLTFEIPNVLNFILVCILDLSVDRNRDLPLRSGNEMCMSMAHPGGGDPCSNVSDADFADLKDWNASEWTADSFELDRPLPTPPPSDTEFGARAIVLRSIREVHRQ